MRVAFVTVDVFTNTQFGGNPLAVIPDGRGLTAAQMQVIAGEFNLSETTFVLPPKDTAHTAEVRIFTPGAELPFAGHPNVGTAFVLTRAGQVHGTPISGDRLGFEEKAGLVWMDILRTDGEVSGAQLAAPQPFSIVEKISPAAIATARSVSEGDITTSKHDPVVATCGTAFVFVELKNLAALAAARPNETAFAAHFSMARVAGIHLYVRTPGESVDVQCRMFAPLNGILEDPATGGANVALVGLSAALRPEPNLRLVLKIAQGIEMGRPSLLDAKAVKVNGKVTDTFIGGTCVPMMVGHLELV